MYTFLFDSRAFLEHVYEENKAFLQLIFLVICLMVFTPLQIFIALSWTLKKNHPEHKLYRASAVHRILTVNHHIHLWSTEKKGSPAPQRQHGY